MLAEEDSPFGLEDDLLLLQQAYFNERSAPELLAYLDETVKNLLDVIAFQQSTHLDTSPNSSGSSNNHLSIKNLFYFNIYVGGQSLEASMGAHSTLIRTIYELEIERVKYLLRAYIELRLEKVNI